MDILISLVVGDISAEGIRTTASADPTVIQQDLLEFYNDAVEDEGLQDEAPLLPADADLETIIQHIENWIGRTVVIQETWLISRD